MIIITLCLCSGNSIHFYVFCTYVNWESTKLSSILSSIIRKKCLQHLHIVRSARFASPICTPATLQVIYLAPVVINEYLKFGAQTQFPFGAMNLRSYEKLPSYCLFSENIFEKVRSYETRLQIWISE